MKANTQTIKRWCINILFTILTFTGNKFKTTGKRVQGESTECYIKEDGEKAEEEEEEEKWISTSNHLVKTSTDGSISPSLLLSVSLSLSHALFLSRSDRFIKRQGSKRVPSSLLSSSLAFSSSSSTDSISSFPPALSSSSLGPSLYSSAPERK